LFASNGCRPSVARIVSKLGKNKQVAAIEWFRRTLFGMSRARRYLMPPALSFETGPAG
jgi:hypothetical protein